MGDLSKELLKAGLISRKQYREAQHQERVKRTKVGRPGLEAEERRRRAEHERRNDARRRKDRERVRQEQQAVEEKITRARLKDVIRNAAVTSGMAGSRRFYFVASSGAVPFLEVSDEAARKLQVGDLAIVQVPDVKQERFVMLPGRLARQVQAIEPELVRVFRPRGSRS